MSAFGGEPAVPQWYRPSGNPTGLLSRILGIGDAVMKTSIDCSHLPELAFVGFDKLQWDLCCLPKGSKNIINVRDMAAGSFSPGSSSYSLPLSQLLWELGIFTAL